MAQLLQSQLSAAQKREIAIRVDGMRAVDRMAMAAQAVLAGNIEGPKGALALAGEARAMLRASAQFAQSPV